MPRKRDFVFSLRLLMKFQPGENTAKQNIFHFNIIVFIEEKDVNILYINIAYLQIVL